MQTANTSFILPEPDSDAQDLSQQLKELICAEIDSAGPMTFARYMELALYAPKFGYYRSGIQKFGPKGDFITAPELSPLFSKCLARQCQQILKDNHRDILELGAGSGVMARVILETLAEQNALPQHYYILELSAELQARQREHFLAHAPQLLPKVIWLHQLPDHFRGVILANEVIDAMPVHRLGYLNGWQEFYVVNSKQNGLAWQLGPVSSAKLLDAIQQLEIEPANGYTTEINLYLEGWVASLSHSLASGAIFLIDYGLTQTEYYHPDRSCGTIMCHYRHLAHDNPFWWPGLQDITAQVNFTAVASAAIAHHLEVEGYTHQAAFLLNCGLTDLMTGLEDPRIRIDLSRQIQRLTLPGEMGEAFKVMALTRIFHHQATANAKEPESLGVFLKIAWLHSATMRPRDFEKNAQIFRLFHVLATPAGEISGLTRNITEELLGFKSMNQLTRL